MLNRRSFLRGLGSLTLAGGLNGCDPGARDLDVIMLEGSIPLQLIKQFRSTIKDKNVNFRSEKKLKNLLDLLKNWSEKSAPSMAGSGLNIPFISKSSPPIADLATLGDSWLTRAIENRTIRPLEADKLKNWSALPPRWRQIVRRDERGFPDANGKIWGAPYRWGSVTIAYREDKFQGSDWRPRDWSDLWRPELKGRIVLPDNAREVIGLTLKEAGFSYNSADLDKIPGLAARLGALNSQVKFYSSDYYLQPLVIGDAWLAVGWSSDTIPVSTIYNEVKVVLPKSGSSLWSDVWVQPVKRENNPLGTAWLDYCWLRESADRISLFTDALSPLIVDRPPDKIPSEIRKNPLLTDREALARSEFLEPLSPTTREQYLKYWREMREVKV